jgi:hypothetical protein
MQAHSPLPEAIDGNRWIVREGSGSCNTVNKVMRVPMGPSEGDRHVRNHEMVHGKITPRVNPAKQCEKFEISMDAMQVCEDLRVHKYMRHVGMERPGTLSQAEVDSCIGRSMHSDRQIALMLVASLATDDYDRAIRALKERMPESKVAIMIEHVKLIDKRMNGAKKLFRPIGFRNGTAPAAKIFDAIWPETGESDYGNLPLETLMGKECRGGHSAKWGTMSIATLPSSLTRHVAAIAKQKSFHDEGSALAAPHRILIDGRVFCSKKPHRGGTVLIDASASMNLKQADLDRILITAPATTIAIYSGRGKGGKLTIIGQKGRIIDTRHTSLRQLSSKGNVVDGPALEWLEKQQAPRLWISDGWVTGKNDTISLDLAAAATRICNRAHIKRVEKADAVLDLLRAAKG